MSNTIMIKELDELNQHVLVADDDPSILRLVKTSLEKQGFKVITANNGGEAYRLLALRIPFVGAILDVTMPQISGTDIIKHMKNDRRLMNIPVVIMTAEESPLLAAESLSSGAISFLPKPFSIVQLQTISKMFISEVKVELK
jgi:DNA-binding NtrC family response regulator